MDWGKLKSFYYVALCQNFTKAGRVLGMSQSNMSTAIKNLEESMGRPLFTRHPSGVTLTKNGQELLAIVKPFFEKMEAFQDMIEESSEVPRGDLVVAGTQGMVNFFLSPFLGDFLNCYPEINLKVFPKNDRPNFDVDGIDIAIFEKIPNRPDLIQKHLIRNHYALYASPGYLNKFGVPQTVDDLENHKLIDSGMFSDQLSHLTWLLTCGLEDGQKRTPYCSIFSLSCRMKVAEKGVGIISAPAEHPDLSNNSLVRILPDMEPAILDSYLIYPEHMKNSKKIKAFERFMMPLFTEHYGQKLIKEQKGLVDDQRE